MSIGMKRGTVYLEEHQVEWEENAKEIINVIKYVLQDIAVDVQHVGSTSIKNIKAKPIIDIAVAVKDYDAVLLKRNQLECKNIIFRFDERPNQLLFVKGDFKADTRTHHIHVVQIDSLEWNNYLNFRDYLNSNESAAKEYEKVKERLADEFPNDRNAYLNGKGAVVSKLLDEATKWRENIIC